MSSAALKTFFLSLTPRPFLPYWRRLESSPLGYRLAKGAFWSLVGTLLSRSLTVISSILVARMLGKTGMGELGIIQNTVGILSALAGLGMGLTATKYVAEYRHDQPARAGAMLRLSATTAWTSGLLMTLTMLLLAPWFARHTIAAPHLAGLLRAGSVLLLLGAVNGAQMGALAGFEAFATIARVNFLAGLLSLPLMAGGAAWLGLNGAVGGLVASNLVNCVLSHLHLRRQAATAGVPLAARFSRQEWNLLWAFSVPSVLCGTIFGPVNWACCALLVNRPGGYAEMGLFNVTMSWFSAVTFLPGVLAQVLLPLLSAQQAERAHDRSRKLVILATKANALAAFPVAVLIACASPIIMSLYGPEFREGWPTLVLTALTAAIIALHGPAAQSIIAGNHMWPYLAMHLGWGSVYFAATFAFVSYGAFGLAIARMLAYLLSSLAVFLYAARNCWPATQDTH
ncbi:MAG TPA: oligosaccharide flippase family protein [Verrucomicrobiae bacterium]